MKLDVEVTSDDIANARARSCWYCAVSIAISRVVRPYAVFTDTRYAHILVKVGVDRPLIVLVLPTVATVFIHDFDAGRPVSPFRFQITVPDDGAHLFQTTPATAGIGVAA